MPNRRDLLALLAAGVLVAAARPAFTVEAMSSEVAQRIAEAKTRLQLTPEQEAQLRPLIEERNQKLKAIRDRHAGDTSRSAKRAMFKEAKPVQTDYETKVRGILTDEQEKEWEAMRKEALAADARAAPRRRRARVGLMRILDRSVYVGPSHYARFPVVRLELDLGELEAWPTGRLGAGYIEGLAAALPGLAEHGCSYREPGGFLRRMREGEGTWLGHVLEHVAIELQNVAGEDVTFGKTRSIDGRPGVYTVVYEFAQRDEGVAAGELGLRLLGSLLPAEIRPSDVVPRRLELARGAR